MLRFAVLATLLTGCSIGWEDVPGAVVYATVPSDPTGTALRWWGPEVKGAIDAWTEVLGPSCPAPFSYVSEPRPGAHAIRLLSPWPHGDDYAGMIDSAEGGAIDIRVLAQLGRQMTLMHELGHAIGLDHRPDAEVDAIMRAATYVTAPNPSEIEEARSHLGCL